MITTILGVITAGLVYWITGRDLGGVWGIVCGVAAAMIFQVIAMLVLRRLAGRINNQIQSDMMLAQQRLQRKMQQFQQRPVGSPKVMQQMLEKEQSAALRKALKDSNQLRKFFLWSPMMKKQLATMQMSLHYQLKEFDKADALMKDALLFDARSVAMKLARMYVLKDPGLERFFTKKCRKFKGEDAAFLCSIYAWMQLKLGNQDKALAALVQAKSTSDNRVVLENWEKLVNGKARHFSNAGFGDAWYSLYLEEPKVKVQRTAPRW